MGLTGRQLSEALRMSPGGIHSASVRGEAFVRENSDLEKSLASYLNNMTVLSNCDNSGSCQEGHD